MSLPAMHAGGPFKLTVRGKKVIEVKDVLIGEVWIASSQSNMTHALSGLKGFAKVNLKPGESKRVSVSLDRRSFVLRRQKSQLERRARRLQILAGSSSARIELQGAFTLADGTNASALLDYGPALLLAQGIHGINLACTARRHKTC